ncbi:hypothetical protein [Uliginosibacterium gangwonense]|uniref:hypothetical protein n=1 Tax=Uliginosibacterium gangwonense TaxID=392736 RepID=UPI00035CCD12|nr:hypothetical protein [Uliginosibacterium gangwonense]
MPEYTVVWEIQISAESHEEAAAEALEIMRRPDSIATVFHVTDKDDVQVVCDAGEGIVLRDEREHGKTQT